MEENAENEATVSTPARRLTRLAPALAVLAVLFAALYLIAWLATRYDGGGTNELTAAVASSVPETTVAPTTTTEAPTTTVAPTTAAPTTTTTTAPTTTTTEVEPTIGDLVRNDPNNFSTLLAAATTAGFGDALDADGPFTVFAPTDAAFSNVDRAVLEQIVADTDLLSPTIAHHLVEGSVSAAELVGLDSVTTLSGETLSVTVDGDDVFVGGVRVAGVDLAASNGLVHVVDGVLVPQSVSSTLTAGAVTELLSLEPIQFADSSAAITAESIPTLEAALALLTDDPGAQLEIAGHTDDIGPADGNLRLSQRRADAVRTWLIDNGIDADRLTAVGYGQDRPIADNSTAEGRAANRRIEFVAR